MTAPTEPEGLIIRTAKDRHHPYVLISRDVFHDTRLSWEARGLLGYLLSKPDDWEIRFANLLHQGPGGRDRMRRILRELQDRRLSAPPTLV